MEIVEAIVITALYASIRLGLPVVVLCIVGYRLYRASSGRARAKAAKCDPRLCRPGSRPTRDPCWAAKGCAEEVRQRCAAYRRRDLACWQAMKRYGGRLRDECLQCDLFLTVPGR